MHKYAIHSKLADRDKDLNEVTDKDKHKAILHSMQADKSILHVMLAHSPDTRLPKWSMTSNRSVGSTFPLGKPAMTTASSVDEALMAAAALARFPPNPKVELLPSQSSQLAGVSVELKLFKSA